MLCVIGMNPYKYTIIKKQTPHTVPGIRFFCYILSFYFLFHNLSIVSQLKYELYLRSFAQFTVYMDLGSVKHGSVFYD